MTETHSDDVDKRLINLLQVDFPLTATPYEDMGRRLGISEDEAITRIGQLKARAIIRLIGPVMEARKLGYRTTLAAMSVPAEKLKQAGQIISGHPAISHGYERDHHFNLWITYAAPAGTDLDAEVNKLATNMGSKESFSLPALRIFKIGAYFGMGDDEAEAVWPTNRHSSLPDSFVLSTPEKLVINTLQQDLPLIHRPFTPMAESAGLKTEAFLKHCAALLENGVMRRYSASINHRNAGYKANAMVCWLAPESLVEEAGREMSRVRQVSHCYERRTNLLWPYNLYTMIHTRSQEISQDLVREISHKTGLRDYLVLFSTREFKKSRIKYTV